MTVLPAVAGHVVASGGDSDVFLALVVGDIGLADVDGGLDVTDCGLSVVIVLVLRLSNLIYLQIRAYNLYFLTEREILYIFF